MPIYHSLVFFKEKKFEDWAIVPRSPHQKEEATLRTRECGRSTATSRYPKSFSIFKSPTSRSTNQGSSALITERNPCYCVRLPATATFALQPANHISLTNNPTISQTTTALIPNTTGCHRHTDSWKTKLLTLTCDI